MMRISMLAGLLLGLLTDVSVGEGLAAEGVAFSPHDAANATPETVARVKALKPGETLRFKAGVWHFRREGAERMFLSPSRRRE